jgi:hypothetical protein
MPNKSVSHTREIGLGLEYSLDAVLESGDFVVLLRWFIIPFSLVFSSQFTSFQSQFIRLYQSELHFIIDSWTYHTMNSIVLSLL